MKTYTKTLSIIVPCYNEEESVPLFYAEAVKQESFFHEKDVEFEFIFVDDGSKDGTVAAVKALREKDARVHLVSFSRNFGKEVAMMAGFDYVTGDCAVIMDADLQHPPELIPDMLKLWEEGYDDVYAKRKTRDGETFLKKTTSKMYYKVLQKMTRIEIQKDTGDFRLLDRRCVNALRKLRESQRCSRQGRRTARGSRT